MRIISDKHTDYECLDAGLGEKLERWGDIILRRPDPACVWNTDKENDMWTDAHADYHRSDKGGGYWDFKKKLKDSWIINYRDLKFKVTPTNFKHTGLFPEQSANWDYVKELIDNSDKKLKVLNLFAYTGAATVSAAKAGAHVTHVDAAKKMIEWAKVNADLSGVDTSNTRFICDDCLKFVKREQRRGNKYDIIIMDPPSYGRGPNGEVWKFEDNIYNLVKASLDILEDKPTLLLINSYTTGVSSLVIENILKNLVLKRYEKAVIETGELGLPIKKDNLTLPCGIYGRFTIND